MKSAHGEQFVVEGEGITEETAGDVYVISSRLAQHNGLRIGDTLALSTRDDNDGTYRYLSVAQDFIAAAFREGYFDLPVVTAPLRIIGIYDEDGRTTWKSQRAPTRYTVCVTARCAQSSHRASPISYLKRLSSGDNHRIKR